MSTCKICGKETDMPFHTCNRTMLPSPGTKEMDEIKSIQLDAIKHGMTLASLVAPKATLTLKIKTGDRRHRHQPDTGINE